MAHHRKYPKAMWNVRVYKILSDFEYNMEYNFHGVKIKHVTSNKN